MRALAAIAIALTALLFLATRPPRAAPRRPRIEREVVRPAAKPRVHSNATAAIEGLLVDLEGEPIGGAGLVARRVDGEHAANTTSRSDGGFAWRDLPAGSYRISGTEGAVRVRIDPPARVVAGETNVRLVGRFAARLRADVRCHETGEHIAEVRLIGPGFELSLEQGRCDVVCEVPEYGRVELEFHASGYESMRYSYPRDGKGTLDVRAALVREGTPNLEIHVLYADGRRYEGTPEGWIHSSSGSGRVRFRPGAPGHFAARVPPRAGGRLSVGETLPRVSVRAVPRRMRFELPPSGRAVIVRESPIPVDLVGPGFEARIEGARVLFEPSEKRRAGVPVAEGERVEVRGLAAGPWAAYGRGWRQAFTVTAGEETVVRIRRRER